MIGAFGVVIVSSKGFKLPLLSVSHRTLKTLAALFWYVGGIVLLIKGCSLLLEAEGLHPHRFWPWASAAAALLAGALKSKFIFNTSCRRNLVRIAAIDRPKIWQFFRPVFFLFLSLMIFAGAMLSRLAHGNYPFLLGVAALDLTIATGLLGSSHVFWRRCASS